MLSRYLPPAARSALLVLTGCAGVLVFHRATLLSGLDALQADPGDSRLIIFLLEHWNRALAGSGAWASPPMFYPTERAWGYSDMLFGTGVLYAVVRTLGLGLFHAANATLVILSLLSYASAYWLLRRALKLGCAASVVGAFFFAFAYPKFIQLPHLQLRFDFFQPLALGAIAPLFLEDRVWRPRDVAIRSSAFVALFCLGASTAFYLAWFFLFLVSVSAAVGLTFPLIRARMAMHGRQSWRVFWIPVTLAGILLLPFFYVYLPAMRLPGRNWQSTIDYIPTIADYVWLGPEHFLWGGLRFNLPDGIVNPIEKHLGIGFAVTGALLIAWGWALRHLIGALRGTHRAASARADSLAAILCGSLIVTVVTMHWGPLYPWKAIYQLIPGASAMLAVGRWAITLALPVSILLAVGIDSMRRRWTGHPGLASVTIVVVALFIALEQVGRIPYSYSGRVAAAYHEELARAVPAACEAFLLVPPDPSEETGLIGRGRFDEARYLAANPDVARNWRGDAWAHYRQFGYHEGRTGFLRPGSARSDSDPPISRDHFDAVK